MMIIWIHIQSTRDSWPETDIFLSSLSGISTVWTSSVESSSIVLMPVT